jgi:hypothetical protein
MKQFIAQHGFYVGLGTLWAFSALVSGMPAPVDTDSKGYRWLYGSLHSFAGNLSNIVIKPPVK